MDTVLHSFKIIRQDEEQLRELYSHDVRRAFEKRPFILPTKYLYDERGCELFARYAASTPDYYPHLEQPLIAEAVEALRPVFDVPQIIEYGAGACPRLVEFLAFGLLNSRTEYRPLDISDSPMIGNLARICSQNKALRVAACIGDFENWPAACYAPVDQAALILWLGNTAANMDEASFTRFLGRTREAFRGPTPSVLLGINLVDGRPNAVDRFPDPTGLFGQFRWNALDRLNRTFDGNFKKETFSLGLDYNDELNQAESFFRSKLAQSIYLKHLDLTITFEPEDRIVVGVTRDFTETSLSSTVGKAGWKISSINQRGSGYSLIHLKQL